MHRLLAALLLLLHPAASFQPLSSQLSEKKGKPQRVLLARALLPLAPSAPHSSSPQVSQDVAGPVINGAPSLPSALRGL